MVYTFLGAIVILGWMASLRSVGQERAARALARAGLAEDAVGVLENALANSPRPDQRVLVEHVLRRF